MKRSPSQPDILDWEELAQAPNTKGAFSFLKAPGMVINIDEHQSPLANAGVKTSTVDKASTVDKVSTVDALQTSNTLRRYRIHPCQRVQDGHSHGENLLYDALWQAGRIETESSRTVTMGWDRMARAAGMSDKAAKRNLAQLIHKLAIEQIAPEDSCGRRGRTYRVFSFKSILEHRTQAGMTHVIKDKGVRFVSKDGVSVSADVQHGGVDRSAQLSKTSTVGKASTVDNTFTVTVDKTSTDTVDKTSPLLGSSLGIKERKTTTMSAVDVVAVVAAMCEYFPGDRAAAERIIESALAICPDCSTGDVVAAIRRKAAQILGQESIKNPVAVLMSSCADLVVVAHTERLGAEAQQSEETAHREQGRRRADFFSFIHGLPADNAWEQIREKIQREIPAQSYETWLKPIQFAGISGRTLRVCAPSHEFKHIGEKYADSINHAIQSLGLDIATIECLTIDELIHEGEQTDAH